MATIVTTLFWVPLAAVLAGVLFLVGSSLLALVTFGGALNAFLGAAAWWLIGFLPALGYAAYVMPWEGRES